MKRRLGEGLSASFQPSVHWGAEFLQDRIRLCGIRRNTLKLTETFEGTYEAAADFARARGLAFEGLHAAISHLPFRWKCLGPDSPDLDTASQVQRLKPIGLPTESLEVHEFTFRDFRYALLLREDALRGFLESLPSDLASLWNLVPSPWVLAQAEKRDSLPERWAALLPGATDTHLLYFRRDIPEAQAKMFYGWEQARANAETFRAEIKKALLYHYGAKYPGSSLEAITLWGDSQENEIASILRDEGYAVRSASFPPPLELIPRPFKVAAAMALQAAQSESPPFSFWVPEPRLAKQQSTWMRRSRQLALAGSRIAMGMAAISMVALVAAMALKFTVNAKATAWSGELQKWEQFQASRFSVERDVQAVGGIFEKRTTVYLPLQKISAQLPSDMWLSEWEVEPDQAVAGRSTFVHRLTGYSLVEDRVSQFLANLEGTKAFHSVKLKTTELVKGDAVEKKTLISANRKDLVRFQVVVTE
jgi:Tfp pilus assembly protein PilN